MSLTLINDLLQSCCNLAGGNFLLGILIFTVITKILLLPVSLWCQYNGLIMVRLMPEINRIKREYVGDFDMIAEEQRKLFKRERYQPLSSFLPLAAQIFLLLTLFAAIDHVLKGSQGAFAGQIPVRDGGLAWIMPGVAGVAAAIFGWSQNYQNPLQREQSSTQQLLTNLCTIGISLSLGFFVQAGVSFYWTMSNLLSIPIQLVCNLILVPSKYVDYYKLRKSQKLMQQLADEKDKITPEMRKREKADYKRFFSVANKHLVFYSEGSGFFKYFEQLINYLLDKSNVIIHYVTSDPNDQIFEKAQEQPRLRPYYIGNIKLITLFMKMDADIVVMTTPDLGNFHLKRSLVRKDIEYIYIEHAISSTHLTVREHAYDNFDTFFCTNQNQIDELRAMEKLYKTKEKTLVPCGYGLLESLLNRHASEVNTVNERKKILLAPSWQEGCILDSGYKQILEQLAGNGFEITVRPHPEYVKRFPAKWAAVTNFCKSKNWDDVIVQQDFSSNSTIFSSDLVITDWSGIAYEFAFSVLKPVLFINTPMKVINRNYRKIDLEPIDITMRTDTGLALETDELDRTLASVKELLDNPDKYQQKITASREKYVFNLGHSGAAGGKYILKRLVERQQKSKK